MREPDELASVNTIMNPFRFHELERQDFIYRLTKQFRLSVEHAGNEFDAVTAVLQALKPIRDSQSRTDDYLTGVVDGLRLRIKAVIIMHLLNATENDDTYCYSYNDFVYYANLFLRRNIPRKEIPERVVLLLLEKERRAEAEAALKSAPLITLRSGLTDPNPLVFGEELLNRFYLALDGIIWEHTDIETMKNWFRVTQNGKPGFKPGMITYFCYALSKIEERIDGTLKPRNFNSWIRPVINGNNYSAMKNSPHNNEKTKEIDRRMENV